MESKRPLMSQHSDMMSNRRCLGRPIWYHISLGNLGLGMSISNCPFPNKEDCVDHDLTEHTAHFRWETYPPLSVVFGTKSEIIRSYMFTGFHRHYSIWPSQHPHAKAREGRVISIVKMQMEKFREVCWLPGVTQWWVSESSTESKARSWLGGGGPQHATLQIFSADPLMAESFQCSLQYRCNQLEEV